MRFLSAELEAAQKARRRIPYLEVTIKDRLAGIRRLRPSQWYAGAEADQGHAAVVADDGSLNRVRFDGSTLYRSRVTTPTSGDDYSAWTSWGTYKASVVALARDTNGKLWCFVVSVATETQVYASTSTDDGASWTGFSLQFTHTVNVTYIAAAAGGTDIVVLVAIAGGTSVSAYRYTGSWAAAVTKSGLPTISGLACHYGADWNTLITGSDADGAYVQSLLFGDGFSQPVNTWSSALTIHEANAAANIAFAYPSLGRPDVYRATFRQQYTGTQAYDRTMRTLLPGTATFADDLWREPVPFDLAAPYGVAISNDAATQLFYTTARYVYRASLDDADLDVTADVIGASLYDQPLSPAPSYIDLNNADGSYTVLTTGAVSVITKGAEVRVQPGYRTSAGNQSSYGPGYHITSIEHTYERGRAVLRLVLGSQISHLARFRFPRSVTFAEGDKNIFNQVAYILARVAGYETSSVGGSPESGNLYPPLTIAPGTSALTALRRILDRIPDVGITRGEFFFFNEPLAADAADATYERPFVSGDQRITSSTYGDRLKDANHIQIFAHDDASIYAEDLDFAEIDLLYSSPLQRHDPFIDTGAEAVDRADREQRKQVIYTSRNDSIVAPVHCGLETNDVIAVTDSLHGLTSAKRRVLTLQLIYQRGRRISYHHLIKLGAP